MTNDTTNQALELLDYLFARLDRAPTDTQRFTAADELYKDFGVTHSAALALIDLWITQLPIVITMTTDTTDQREDDES